MLRVSQLAASYGKHLALAGVDLHVERGEIVVVLGANGAGKSTLLKAVAGLVPHLPGGSVTLGGRSIDRLAPHEIVEAGVALVPEGRGIFGDLTVRENLLLGAHPRRARANEKRNLELVVTLFPRLRERFEQPARTMSGGEQQMVAIGRAMMSAPELLLLDEPSLGLAPALCHDLFESLAKVRETGIGVLLVEQNARQSLRIADRGYLIETGRIVGHGEAQRLATDPGVQEAYLGINSGDRPILLPSTPHEPAEPPLPDFLRTNLINGPVDAAVYGSRNAAEGAPMFHTKLIIADREVAAGDSRTFDRLDPVTGEIATRAAAASIGDAQKAADAAAAAFPEWSALPPVERRRLLLKAADVLQSKGEEFAAAVLAETGSPGHWGHFNVMLAADMIREAAAMTTQITGDVIPANRPGSMAMAIRQPVGVILSIAPWNAPVILGVRAIAMPLACGNTVVFKASENCPRTHALIVECFREAGLPKGALNLVTNAPADAQKIVEALIAHPRVKRINFTGSTRVGRIIAETAARYLKPVLLELGGKAPLVVLDDADIDQAVNAAAFGAFANQGQICMSTEKIVLDDRIAEQFLQKLAAKASGLPAGDPRGQVVLGACISTEAVRRVAELIKDALGKGAKLVAGGPSDGPVMGATVLDRVTPAMRIYDEESFGPVTCVVRVDGEDEAINVANDTEYGLAAAIFTRDIARGLRLAKRIESGICHINGPTVHDEAQMPFGGVKASGYGRFGGKAAIDEFTELRWITIQTEPMHYPF
jgi:acyl-CoA reductase-like NAD-dependent aldehyde dehydrogenase/ABC-type branched-subunit amino acid transport system ATPase component